MGRTVTISLISNKFHLLSSFTEINLILTTGPQSYAIIIFKICTNKIMESIHHVLSQNQH